MEKQEHEYGITYSDIYRDEHGRQWDLLIREGGSVSVYTTYYGCHSVVYDTLDSKQPDELATKIIEGIKNNAAAFNAMLDALNTATKERS